MGQTLRRGRNVCGRMGGRSWRRLGEEGGVRSCGREGFGCGSAVRGNVEEDFDGGVIGGRSQEEAERGLRGSAEDMGERGAIISTTTPWNAHSDLR